MLLLLLLLFPVIPVATAGVVSDSNTKEAAHDNTQKAATASHDHQACGLYYLAPSTIPGAELLGLFVTQPIS